MATGRDLEQRELAEFIRAGSQRGHQCFGSYFDEKGGSCALGAVYEGVYHLPRHHGKLVPDHLERLFRCLDEVIGNQFAVSARQVIHTFINRAEGARPALFVEIAAEALVAACRADADEVRQFLL